MFETSPVHVHGYFCLQSMTKLEFFFFFACLSVYIDQLLLNN